jgi:uncharacterized membrane protein
MNKIKKTQVLLLVLGLFIMCIGIYLVIFESLGLGGMILITTGLGVALSGYRYQQTEKTIQRQKVKMTSGRMVVIIGLIIFFPSLGFGLISEALNLKPSWILTAFAFCFLIGIPLILAGRQMIN